MNDQMRGAVPLGQADVYMSRIVIYPLSVVKVREGGNGISDATHYLSIMVPSENLEVRIPYNAQALRRLGREVNRAGGIAQPAQDETEGNK